MQRLRRVVTPLSERKALHDVEHLDCGNAMTVRRQLIDRPAAILGRHGIDPFSLERGKVGKRHRAAMRRS